MKRWNWPCIAVFAGALALYLATMCPTVHWYDSAEFAAAAAVLGIPHPPGYPLYTLLGHLYVLLLPGEPALAVNAMSAVHGALAIALLFYVQRQLGADVWGALVGALMLATGSSYWLNCSIAEVYSTGILFLLLTFALLLHGIRHRSKRWLVLAALAGGLGFSAHMFVATAGLGLAWLVWHGAGAPDASLDDGWRQRLGVVAQAALATFAGACFYLYLPIRSAMNPPMSFAGGATVEQFTWSITGGAYKDWFITDYALGERLLYVLALFDIHLTAIGLLLGVTGLVLLVRRDRHLGIGLVLALLGNVWFFFDYQVHDLEVFFLPAATVLCMGAGLTLTWVRTRLNRTQLTRIAGAIAVAAVGGYFVLRGAMIGPAVDLSDDRSAYAWGELVAKSLPPNAIVVDFTTPPEWKHKAVWEYYFQAALGYRSDVTALEFPPPDALRHAHATGRPMYVYAPSKIAESAFVLEPEGPLLRARLRLRQRPR